MNLTHRYINNKQGKPEFIILPIAEYESLLANAIPYDDDNEEDWEKIPVEKDEFDDVTIPNEVVWIMAEKNVNSLGAWRIYRNLSQQEVAEMAG
ncbi:transcriptional regulator [Haemophilus parahaemolyticus]|nr:transcriptional regulator [Haemophilus parahaemolyticus]STO65154.1 transcriptional regulator [Haemophilus parahaemolyticus]